MHASRTRRASRVTSGPTPSPPRSAILYGFRAMRRGEAGAAIKALASAGPAAGGIRRLRILERRKRGFHLDREEGVLVLRHGEGRRRPRAREELSRFLVREIYGSSVARERQHQTV